MNDLPDMLQQMQTLNMVGELEPGELIVDMLLIATVQNPETGASSIRLIKNESMGDYQIYGLLRYAEKMADQEVFGEA